MNFCTTCGKEPGACVCVTAPAVEAAPVQPMPTPVEQAAPVADPMAAQQPMQQPMMQQPMMAAPMAPAAPAGPGMMDQVKKIFSSGMKIFSKPDEAINESKDDSSIANVGITMGLATLALFITMFIFKKVHMLFATIQAMAMEGAEVGFLDLAEGLPGVLGLDSEFFKELTSEFGFEQWFKLFVACLAVVAVFFIINAVASFCIAKMDGKAADFKNVLVSSNVSSFVFTVGIVLVGLSTAINGTVAYAMIVFVLLYFAQTMYQYFKIKFDISSVKLAYMVPALILVTIGLGTLISAHILKALEVMEMFM